MLYLRSLVFNVVFYLNLAVFLLGGLWVMLGTRRFAIRALQLWARVSGWWLRIIAGIDCEVVGLDRVPPGPVLVAAKHQSAWDTFALLPLFDDPAMVLKRELMWIPVYGWFARKFGMIGVDRNAGPRALRRLVADARACIAEGRQIVIFPEGTRRPPDSPPDYKPGVAALYAALGVPCVPIALNSGLYWPRRRFLRHPGTIRVEVLEPIPPGLDRKRFVAELIDRIEPATARLVARGRAEQARFGSARQQD